MPRAPSLSLMLLLLTVMCVIAEKKMQLNSASLYVVVIFINGGILIGRGPGPPLATPMPPTSYTLRRKTTSMMKDFFDLQLSASASKPE